MFADLHAAAAEQHRQALLQEGAPAHRAAQAAGPHPWRQGLGRRLVRLGEALIGAPASERAAGRRTRIA